MEKNDFRTSSAACRRSKQVDPALHRTSCVSQF